MSSNGSYRPITLEPDYDSRQAEIVDRVHAEELQAWEVAWSSDGNGAGLQTDYDD